jgi:hypothetical protein
LNITLHQDMEDGFEKDSLGTLIGSSLRQRLP